MKKAFLLLLVWMLSSLTALRADVATPDPVRMKQPDGSTITLRLHGDEFLSWYTDLNGNVYVQDHEGWWRRSFQPAITPFQRMEARRLRRVREERFVQNTKSQAGLGLGKGSNHFLIILVEWSDKKFQDGADSYFPRMLNETGFNDDGAVGSAKDYWTDASNGQFTPSFDVYGPITIDRKSTDFPKNDSEHHYEMARTMVVEALSKLDETSEIDFTIYDNDKDGYIDNVYMFYPGYAQSNGGGEDTIWPHAWAVSTNLTFDGVRPGSYACSSELNGSSGTTLNGCGTFCHEFGHVIGLPDLYDTDYEENGDALNPSRWNLMAGGNHNGGGRVPCALSSYERYILGYIDSFEDVSATGSYTLPAVSSNRGFSLPTANAGEFFILEVRDGTKWDQDLPAGLIVYHSDHSENMVADATARERWDYWYGINDFGEHPCHYIIPPVDDDAHRTYFQLWVLPKDDYNYHNLTETQPKAWSGLEPYRIKDIVYSGGKVSLKVGPGERQVAGTVSTDLSAGVSKPIAGATVLVLPAPESTVRTKAGGPALSSAGHGLSLTEARKKALGEAVTDSKGAYLIKLGDADPDKLTLAVYASGYLPVEEIVTGRSINKNVKLTPIVSGLGGTLLTKANLPLTAVSNYGGKTAGTSFMVGQLFEADEIKAYVGKTIESIQFATAAKGESIYVFVDFGTTRVLTRKITAGISTDVVTDEGKFGNEIDISDAKLVVPAGKSVTFGYMVENSDVQHYMLTDGGPGVAGGFMIGDANHEQYEEMADYSENFNKNALVGMSVSNISAFDDKATLSDMGISYIAPPSGELKAGAAFRLSLVQSESRKPVSVNWRVDNEAVNGTTVKLSAGHHVIQAVLRYQDGAVDTLELRLDVKE